MSKDYMSSYYAQTVIPQPQQQLQQQQQQLQQEQRKQRTDTSLCNVSNMSSLLGGHGSPSAVANDQVDCDVLNTPVTEAPVTPN